MPIYPLFLLLSQLLGRSCNFTLRIWKEVRREREIENSQAASCQSSSSLELKYGELSKWTSSTLAHPERDLLYGASWNKLFEVSYQKFKAYQWATAMTRKYLQDVLNEIQTSYLQVLAIKALVNSNCKSLSLRLLYP